MKQLGWRGVLAKPIIIIGMDTSISMSLEKVGISIFSLVVTEMG